MESNKLLFSEHTEIQLYKFMNKPNLYNEIYLKLINEWAKDLYTPESILSLFLMKILEANKSNISDYSLSIGFNELKNILSKSDYQYYNDFCECLKLYSEYFTKDKINQFKIIVAVFNPKSLNSIKSALTNTKYISYSNYILNIFKTDDYPVAECFKYYNKLDKNTKIEQFSNGCLIALDITQIKSINKEKLETILDHEFNHYFSLLKNKIYQFKSNNNLDKKIEFEQLLKRYGYNVYSKDFETHIFGNSEFISMSSDVCNCIEFELKPIYKNKTNQELYYIFLDLTEYKFLNSNKFIQLPENLQKSLISSYACRLFSKEKWKILKENVYKQLNSPKLNIIKSSYRYLKELFKLV